MKYIIGNWKSHKSTAEVKEWCTAFSKALSLIDKKDIQLVVCPSFVHLALVQELLPEVALGAQTLSPFPKGAYTGAVAAQMVKEFADYAILGHAERRKYFHETDQIVANQAIQALENDITPIVAVEKANWSSQLSQLDASQLKKTIVMYEPAEAISTSANGKPADLEEVKEAIQLIKSQYKVKAMLYGGSVNSKNVDQYIQEEVIDGVVPGAASLEVEEFVALLNRVNSSV